MILGLKVEFKSGVYVACTLLPAEERCLKVCIANTTNKPHVIMNDGMLMPAGILLGRPVDVSTVEDDRQTLTAATRNTGYFRTSDG